MTRRTPSQRIEALVEMAHDAIASDYVAHMSAVNTEVQLDELIDEWEAARAARTKGR